MDPPRQSTATYPIQTSNFASNSNPLPLEEQTQSQLPETIRALQDARGASEHGRTVIICLDGTGDQFDNDNSNVVHFVSCLRKHQPAEQVTYYQSGIGTYDKGGLKNGIGAAADMAVGSGLGIHIKDAYRFLMQNYRQGDKICLLGFSRGAYTVRALCGMLHKVGLLPASNGAQVSFAYNFYKDDSAEGWKMSAQFKKTFCTNVDVYFVGVWDCVASVGFIPRKLPFSKSPTNSIHYFRHAMALDEHRAKFKVCQWQHQNPDIARRGTIDNTPKAQLERGFDKAGLLSCFGKKSSSAKQSKSYTNGTTSTNAASSSRPGTRGTNDTSKTNEQNALEADFEKLDLTRKPTQRIVTNAKEVWFMGGHADVGGGAVANESRHMLSRIPLRWMIRQCFECNTGILFSTAGLAEQGLDINTLYPEYLPASKPDSPPPHDIMAHYEGGNLPPIQRRSTALNLEDEPVHTTRSPSHLDLLPEQMEDYFDSKCSVNDMLVLAKGWWILEIWPVKVRVQMKNEDSWEKKVRMNKGRFRAIRESRPLMHWTVKESMDEGRYNMRGRVGRDSTWQIAA